MLKIIPFIICSLLSFQSFAVQESKILGTWVFVESGKDYKDTKSCTFFEKGKFNCEIEEHGVTQNGWGESTTFSTKGTWDIFDDHLKMSETILGSQRETSFKVSKVNANELVLVLNGNKQIWQRSSTAN
ncbi:hypothetical protein [Shewanella insulae]|uniref:Lipocalin-like domain-containing protein n=1 Tax=Shewanella insulae TaxID=2681496 RepID=A0A6L7I6J9_9GAMM|nr:hypothetical protein [Shewanella insulae]MXR71038.1 hypothetical protein [Shewanella insulae]